MDDLVAGPARRPSSLTDADRAAARAVAAAMPPWTAAQLDELARIVDSAPRAVTQAPDQPI